MVNIPPGFHFTPTEEELIIYYLRKKAADQPLPCDAVITRDLYAEEPWKVLEDDSWYRNTTTDKSGKQKTQKIIYIFTQVKRKGKRIARTAGCGTWNGQTGITKIFSQQNELIALKKTLVYEVNKGCLRIDGKPQGHWIMHEYSLVGMDINGQPVAVIDPFVVCKIKKDDTKCLKVGQENFCVCHPGNSQGFKKRNSVDREESRIQKKMFYGEVCTASMPLLRSPINCQDTLITNHAQRSDGQVFSTVLVPLPSPIDSHEYNMMIMNHSVVEADIKNQLKKIDPGSRSRIDHIFERLMNGEIIINPLPERLSAPQLSTSCNGSQKQHDPRRFSMNDKLGAVDEYLDILKQCSPPEPSLPEPDV